MSRIILHFEPWAGSNISFVRWSLFVVIVMRLATCKAGEKIKVQQTSGFPCLVDFSTHMCSPSLLICFLPLERDGIVVDWTACLGQNYTVIKMLANWSEAQQDCIARGAELSNPRTVGESACVKHLLSQRGCLDRIWLGIRKNNSSLVFGKDNELLWTKYNDWRTFKAQKGPGVCVLMRYSRSIFRTCYHTYGWILHPCGNAQQYHVCQG